MAIQEELELTQQLRKNVFWDEYIIMPNHIHMIMVIDGTNTGTGTGMNTDTKTGIETGIQTGIQTGTARCAPTDMGMGMGAGMGQFGKIVPGSLPSIIRSFKSAATKRINQLRNVSGEKLWQRNYYEHVIRDKNELNRVREYIINNPAKWEEDKYYK